MGTGIWAMHYFVMLTGTLGALDMTFHPSLLYFSLFISIVASYAALVGVSVPLGEGIRSFISAVVVTMGMSIAHFICMSAMQGDAAVTYDYALLFLSILFALAGSFGTFRLFIYERYRGLRYRTAWSAAALAVSVVGTQVLADMGSSVVPIPGRSGVPQAAMDEAEAGMIVLILLAATLALSFSAFHLARRAAERWQRLLASLTLYYDIFTNGKEAILVLRLDAAQTIAEANEQACVMLGMSKRELLGAPLGQVVAGRSRRSARNGQPGGGEQWTIMPRDCRFRLAQVHESLIEIDDQTTYRVAYLRDVTAFVTTRTIATVSKPLSLLTTSGLPSCALLPLLDHLTPSLLSNAAIRYEPISAMSAFEPESLPIGKTRDVKSWDGTILGRLALIRKSEEQSDLAGAEEMWLDRCADWLGISLSSEERSAEIDGEGEAWSGLLSRELRVEFAGGAVSKLLGYAEDELLRRSLLELYHPEDAKHFLLRIRSAEDLHTPYRFQARMLHKGDTWVNMSLMLAAYGRGEDAKVLFMAQRTVEERTLDFLFDQNQKYHFLFDHHPGAVCCFTLEGRFVRWNRGLEKLTGYAAEELIAETFEKVVAEEDIEKTWSHFNLAARGISSTYEIRVRRKDGGTAPLQVTNLPITEGTEIIGVFGISLDASALGRAAKEEEKEGHDEENGEFQESKITKRERDVILLINQGMSNKEIAAQLHISENTVKNHISNIFAKLGISDRSQVPMLDPEMLPDKA